MTEKNAFSLFVCSLAVFVHGCSLDLGQSPWKCNVNGSPLCPSGYECNPANYCVEEGTCPSVIPGCPGYDGPVLEDPVTADDGGITDGSTDPDGQQDGDDGNNPPIPQCGDGLCNGQESCATCSADCGECPEQLCPNGVCDPGETASSCPADCQPAPECTQGQSICADSQNVNTCSFQGTWVTQDCVSVCQAQGFDGTFGCNSVSGFPQCQCGNQKGFGEICDVTNVCETGLECVSFSSSSSQQGFCTRECVSDSQCNGGPSGTKAECILNWGSKKGCGFLCDLIGLTQACPPGMQCTLSDINFDDHLCTL